MPDGVLVTSPAPEPAGTTSRRLTGTRVLPGALPAAACSLGEPGSRTAMAAGGSAAAGAALASKPKPYSVPQSRAFSPGSPAGVDQVISEAVTVACQSLAGSESPSWKSTPASSTPGGSGTENERSRRSKSKFIRP